MNLILSEQYKLAYCPIPKNACTTLKYWFKVLAGDNLISPMDVHKPGVLPLYSFAEFRAINKAKDFTSFVVLRDPYERLLSAYLDKFVTNRQREEHSWTRGYWGRIAQDINSSRNFSFADFVHFVEPSSRKPYKSDQHWATQFERCAALDFDLYLNFAFLGSEMNRVLQRCKIQDQRLPHLNSNLSLLSSDDTHSSKPSLYYVRNSELPPLSATSQSQFYSEELENLVKCKYADDYELYASRCLENGGDPQQSPVELRRTFRPPFSKTFVVHLKAPKHVMDGLRSFGWHNGYWRSAETGLDNGLITLCLGSGSRSYRMQSLAETIAILQKEAESIYQGIAVVWHPEIDAQMVQHATSAKVIAIEADDIGQALEQLDGAASAYYDNRQQSPS